MQLLRKKTNLEITVDCEDSLQIHTVESTVDPSVAEELERQQIRKNLQEKIENDRLTRKPILFGLEEATEFLGHQGADVLDVLENPENE
jgi:hypothetical protein